MLSPLARRYCGTAQGYREGCRCQDCRDARAQYRREWKARTGRGADGKFPLGGGSSGYMDCTEAIDEICLVLSV